MNNISNYEDLLAERKRLENEIEHQKTNLKVELIEVKKQFQPIFELISSYQNLTKQEGKSSLVKTGLSIGMGLLTSNNNIVSKSVSLAALLLPFLWKRVREKQLNKDIVTVSS